MKFFTWGVTLLLSMLETWFWTQNQCFEAWGIIWDNFKKPQIDLNAKNWVQELNDLGDPEQCQPAQYSGFSDSTS